MLWGCLPYQIRSWQVVAGGCWYYQSHRRCCSKNILMIADCCCSLYFEWKMQNCLQHPPTNSKIEIKLLKVQKTFTFKVKVVPLCSRHVSKGGAFILKTDFLCLCFCCIFHSFIDVWRDFGECLQSVSSMQITVDCCNLLEKKAIAKIFVVQQFALLCD